MSISITTKEGKTIVFSDNGRRSAGEQLYNFAIKYKPEWFVKKRTNKKSNY